MHKLKAFGTLLASEDETRTLRYRLLPYGEPGRTNLGTITAAQGAVTFDAARLDGLVVNEEHDPKKPVGRFTSITDDPEALDVSIALVDTQAGRDSYTLARTGLRTGISVEIDEPVIKAGALISGRLTGAGLVVQPAFDTARLTATAADIPTKEDAMPEHKLITETAPQDVDGSSLEAAEAPSPLAPQGPPLLASRDAKTELGALSLAALQEGGAPALTAALADLTTDMDKGKVYIRDQEIGEVWQARKVERPLANSITNKVLTSLTLMGRKKNRTFEVKDWDGNKTEIPSSKFTTEPVTTTAKAMAGAVDIGMELVEFGSEDVLSEVYDQGVDSYKEKSEVKVHAALLEGSTNGGTVPDIFTLVDKAAQTLGAMGANLSFISVASDVFSTLVNLKTADAPWWLNAGQGSISLAQSQASTAGITFSVNPNLARGEVLVGDSRAATLYESKEFRYKALDLPKGGIDVSLIKFWAILVTDPRAIIRYKVGTGTAGAPTTDPGTGNQGGTSGEPKA